MNTHTLAPHFAATLALVLCLAGISRAADAPPVKEVKVDESSFRCIRQMTPVRHFYIDNLLGNTAGTLAAANAPKGAIYPPGSVVQLIPGEVMVKREAGFSPPTGDWEFFELDVSASGSKIRARGFADVKNRFGGNCFTCHVPAREPWDFICETGHGCEALRIDHTMTTALQRADPRCGAEALQPGDRTALFKVRSMIFIGSVVGWAKGLF